MSAHPTQQVRQQAGTPAGGRFASLHRSEGAVALEGARDKAAQDPSDWFDPPPPAQVQPEESRATQVGDPTASLIAARIRAGHALVAARRDHRRGVSLTQTSDILARAEAAVAAAAARLEAADTQQDQL